MDLVTIPTAAKQLGVKPAAISWLVSTHQVESVRMGNYRLVDASDVAAVLARRDAKRQKRSA